MTTDEFAARQTSQTKLHLDWADLCRVLAIYGVVLLHSCGAYFYRYGAIPLTDWLSVNLLDSLVRCSVPLFVMLSGALLLRPQTSPASVANLWKRIAKVLFPLLIWSISYLSIISYQSGGQVDWFSILKKPAMYHLWFVYMIIGLYLLLPVFQILFAAIYNRRDLQIYLLAVWLLITCLPVYLPLPLLSIMQQTSLLGYGGYFIIGAVIASTPRNSIPTSFWITVFIVSVLITFGLTWLFSERAGKPIEAAYVYFSPNVFIAAIAAFVLFTRAKVTTFAAKILRWISDRSFLIYFVHVLSLEHVRYSGFISKVSEHAPVSVTILIISIATFAISLMAATVIRFVPGAQRVFG